MEGRSSIQSFAYLVVIDIVGLLGVVLCLTACVAIGLVWFTPEKEYAPTAACVGPFIVTTMSPVPVGFFKYQNSASLLKNDETAFVSGMPPNVTDAALFLFALVPTRRSWLLPAPALKLASVIWFDDDVVPDVDWMLFSTMPRVGATGVAFAS